MKKTPRRIRKRDTVVPHLKSSKLRKILQTSERETGWKALKSRPVMPIEEQEILQITKVRRKVLQAAVGKSLDKLKLFDEKKRKEAHLAINQLFTSIPQSIEREEAIERLSKLFGKGNTHTFIEQVNRIYKYNLRILQEG